MHIVYCGLFLAICLGITFECQGGGGDDFGGGDFGDSDFSEGKICNF